MKSTFRNCIIIILISFCLLFMTSYLQKNKLVASKAPTESNTQVQNEPVSYGVPQIQDIIQIVDPQVSSEIPATQTIPAEADESPENKTKIVDKILLRNYKF